MEKTKDTFASLENAWENLKQTNEEKEKIRKNNSNLDPIIEAKIDNLNQIIDKYQQHISKLETALNRPKSYNNIVLNNDNSNISYDKSFISYLRQGGETNLLNLEKKSANANRDVGYIVTTKIQETVNTAINKLCPIRRFASNIIISNDYLEIIANEDHLFTGWSDEALSEIDSASPLAFQKFIIPAHELYAQPKATQKLLDDAKFNIEEWLSNKLIEAFAVKENDAFLNGDGEGKPEGILTNNDIKEFSGQLNPANILELYYAISEKFITNATFIVGRETIQKLRMVKEDSNNRYLWQPSFSLGTPDTLLGHTIVVSNNMPKGNNNEKILFGDFQKGYQIVDRQNIHLLRDPFTHKPFVKFYATKRVGGKVLNSEAIKKFSIVN